MPLQNPRHNLILTNQRKPWKTTCAVSLNHTMGMDAKSVQEATSYNQSYLSCLCLTLCLTVLVPNTCLT